MKEIEAGLALLVLALMVTGMVAFGGSAFSLAQFKFWAPQQAEAERKVFEESTSYNHAMVRNLNRLHRDYQLAEDNGPEQKILREAFLHEVYAYDRDGLPPNLLEFLEELESN